MYARRTQRTMLQARGCSGQRNGQSRFYGGNERERERGRGGGSESVGVARGGMGEAGVGRARLHLINLNPN